MTDPIERWKTEDGYPALSDEKSGCCGCGACYMICPKEAIAMVPDEEGFLYPQVDHERCIKCLKCLKACVFKRDQAKKGFEA